MSLDLEFKKRYEQLNKEQKKAVDTIEGPVMVIAGPGTGKTSILTLRIANILKETDTPPSGILALTFTDAGVKAMKMKLREIIGSRADEVRIHTFHGFAGSVIAEFPEHFVHLSNTKQITEVEVEALIRDILKDKKFADLRPFGDPDYYVGKIIGTIKDAKKEAWTPEIVKTNAKKEIERIKNDEDSISSRGPTKGQLKADALKKIEKCERTFLFADVYEEFEVRKRKDKKIDFDDLLFELHQALKNDELLLQLLQEKFLYLLLDEHQDTNDLQNNIVSLLANFFDTPNVFVVGDEKQAIYRFQGASVENFLRFKTLWKGMQVISLQSNYRSHQSILDATYSMIENNYGEGDHLELRQKLVAGGKEKSKPIEVVTAVDEWSMDEYLVSEIKKILDDKGEKSIAIITRKNREVEHLLSLCEVNDIPAKAERGGDIFSHPIGIAYFSLLEFVADPGNTEALAKTISLSLWDLDFETSSKLVRQIRSGDLGSLDVAIPELANVRSNLLTLGPIEYLIYLAQVSGLIGRITSNPLSVEIWRAIVALATDIANRGHINDASGLISVLLDYRKSADKKSIKVPSGTGNAPVEIMTAHSSKGLEYDYVFIPFANEESWIRRPHGSGFVLPREKDQGDEVKDARRLFYVAITRARTHVVIIHNSSDTIGKDLTPVRFIDELDANHVVKSTTKELAGLPKIFPLEKRLEKKQIEVLEYAKNTLTEKGLSVTALNHFLDCPSTFLYKSILKLPEPPSPSSEKGIAMHKALAEVWGLEKKDVKSIQKTIESTTKDFFTRSLLPKNERELVLEELLGFAPQVALALESHFKQDGKVFVENWIEKNFETVYGGEKINVRLHGQMDAIVDTEEVTKVFDYKTRESMSENAIRGNTQDSDGNYFRQLSFYKMLLDGNHRFKNKEIEPSLVFVKPDSKGRCPIVTLPIEKSDIEQVEKEVSSLVESVWSGKFLTASCDDEKCGFCAMKKEFLR